MNICFSPEGASCVDAIDDWWNAHRPESSYLFREELESALEQLAALPRSGPVYLRRGNHDVRRLLLRKTRNHVYYVFNEEQGVLTILSVWSASRGTGPPL